jgi:gentisate 1,2-dioxygenase
MNPKEDQSRAMIAPKAQVHASASTKIQNESYSFHGKPYFEMPSWQKMTVAVSRT